MNGKEQRRLAVLLLSGVFIIGIAYFNAKTDGPQNLNAVPVAFKEPPNSPIREFIWKGHHLEILKAACGSMQEDKTETIKTPNGSVPFRTRSCPGLTLISVGDTPARIDISSPGFILAGNITIGRSSAADIKALLGPEEPSEKAQSEFGEDAEGSTASSINYSDLSGAGYDHVRFDLDEQSIVRRVVWSYDRDD